MSQTSITDVNNIDHNENLFSMNCPFEHNYELITNNKYNNNICECAYYLPEELRATMKEARISVVHINSGGLLVIIDKIEMCLEASYWMLDVITVSEASI